MFYIKIGTVPVIFLNDFEKMKENTIMKSSSRFSIVGKGTTAN